MWFLFVAILVRHLNVPYSTYVVVLLLTPTMKDSQHLRCCVVTLVFLIFSSVTLVNTTAITPTKINLGLLIPLTGSPDFSAIIAPQWQTIMQLAIDDINNNNVFPSITFGLVTVDSKTTPQGAIFGVERMVCLCCAFCCLLLTLLLSNKFRSSEKIVLFGSIVLFVQSPHYCETCVLLCACVRQ